MKIAINTAHCVSGIQKASSITPSKAGAATLRTLWIKANKEEGTISFMSTDASTEFTGTYPAEVSEDGLTGVQAKSFTDLIRTLPEGVVILETNDETQILSVKQGKKLYKLPTSTQSWFKPFASYPEAESVVWSGELFTDIIDKIQFCIDDDEDNPLGCLFINPKENGEIDFCGLDGSKFAQYKIVNNDFYNIIPQEGLLIQKRYISDLKKLLSGSEIELSINNKRLFIKDFDEKFTVSIPLVQFSYPDYRSFLDKFNIDNLSTVKMSRSEIVDALTRINIFNTKDENCVYISIEDNTLVLKSSDKSTGSAVESINAEVNSSVKNIAFITKILIDIFNKFNADNIIFDIVSEDGPCSFKTNEDDSYIVIAMPMHVVDDVYYEEEEV